MASSLEEGSMGSPVVNDPYFPRSWHLPAVKAIDSWNISRGDPDTRICIIDSGVDLRHEDLVGNVHVTGYDAISRQNTTVDTHGHGTMCAGIVAAKPDNGKGVSGLMWNAQIFSCRFLAEDGHGYLSDAIECMQWCVDHDALIMSNSWGTYSNSRALKDSMEYFSQTYGAFYVAAAGNEGLDNDGSTPMYPASYNLSSILSVAATNKSGQLATFSNYGKNSVSIAAPGYQIYSTWANNTYSDRSGTSFATPLVAATLGLMASVRPDISSMEFLASILLDSASHSPVLDTLIAESRFLNVYNAVWRAYTYGQAQVDDPMGSNSLHMHARFLNASNLPVKSTIIQMPDDQIASVLAVPENFTTHCAHSRYPRYNFKAYMEDTLIPKHVFVVEPSEHKVRGRLTFDTCVQPDGPWDSIMVVLDCNTNLKGCICLANNDGCGPKRHGSKVHVRIRKGRRYLVFVLPSDPLERGSYRLRIKDPSR